MRLLTAFFTHIFLFCLVVSASAAQPPMKVVATIFPLADIARQIGGERVSVAILLPAGANEHTYEPTASQMRQVSAATVYIRNGAGLDAWADRLLASARKPHTLVTAADGVKLLPLSEQELIHDDREEPHSHGAGDPHIWLDPIIVRDRIIPAILAALEKGNPHDAPYFRANARRFSQGLTALDKEMAAAFRGVRQKEFIALHSAWAYMAKRYGLRQIASVEPFPGKEPSAKYIAALVTLARKEGVKTVFAEPQLSDKAARVIAAELKGKVLLLDPEGGERITGRDSYLSLMRHNMAAIAKGMR